MEKKYKSIFKPAIARRLLKMGNPIVDIKNMKENPDKTMFYFEVTEKFEQDLAKLQDR